MFRKYRRVKALWPHLHLTDKRFLPLWAALIIALSIQFAPFLGTYLYGLWNPQWLLEQEQEKLPEVKMTVQLDQRPPQAMEQKPPPEPEEEELPEPELEKIKNTIPLVQPRPLPNEIAAKIALPIPEPEEEEDKEPPLPSVFQDPKPCNKKPVFKYPRKAEDEKIEGEMSVRISVDENGFVTNVVVVDAQPPGAFEQEVLEKVASWRCKPDGESWEAIQKIIFIIDPWSKY